MIQIICITDNFTIYKTNNRDFTLCNISTFIAAGTKYFKSFKLDNVGIKEYINC